MLCKEFRSIQVPHNIARAGKSANVLADDVGRDGPEVTWARNLSTRLVVVNLTFMTTVLQIRGKAASPFYLRVEGPGQLPHLAFCLSKAQHPTIKWGQIYGSELLRSERAQKIKFQEDAFHSFYRFFSLRR